MEEYNAIDWGNIEEVMQEIRVQDEWQILQNKLRKRKKKRIIIYFLWTVLIGSIGLSYFFNKVKKIDSEQIECAFSKAFANQEVDIHSGDKYKKNENKYNIDKIGSSNINSSEKSNNLDNQSSNDGKNNITRNSKKFIANRINEVEIKSENLNSISNVILNTIVEPNSESNSIFEPNEILARLPIQNSGGRELNSLNRIIEQFNGIPSHKISSLNIPEKQHDLPLLVDRNNLIRKSNPFISHAALVFSYALAQQKYSSKSSESKLIVERRMKIESPKEQLIAGLVFEKNLKNSYMWTTGIIAERQVTSVNEQLKFTSVEKLDDFPSEILIDRNGNQEIVKSSKDIVVNNQSNALFYNYYYTISVPVGMKKEFYMSSRIQTGIATSLGLNVFRNFSGYLLDPSREEIYIKSKRNEFLKSIFNDLNLSIYGKYKLAHGGSIGVNAFYSLGLNSWELYNGVSESFNHYGIGVSYYFK